MEQEVTRLMESHCPAKGGDETWGAHSSIAEAWGTYPPEHTMIYLGMKFTFLSAGVVLGFWTWVNLHFPPLFKSRVNKLKIFSIKNSLRFNTFHNHHFYGNIEWLLPPNSNLFSIATVWVASIRAKTPVLLTLAFQRHGDIPPSTHYDIFGDEVYFFLSMGCTTGCFTMNDTKVVAYFSAHGASLDLKHVAKISLKLGHFGAYRL